MQPELNLPIRPAAGKPAHQSKSTALGRRKSKTGCGTCKARRIKCDEGKPVCFRCRSTGRTCDGYGVFGGGGNTYAERYGRVSTAVIQKPLTKVLGVEELPKISATLPTPDCSHNFWLVRVKVLERDRAVLPATSSEPAVLHAAIALSAAHRCIFDLSQAPDAREKFTLQQYSKAIYSLQPLMQRGDKASISVVLVAC